MKINRYHEYEVIRDNSELASSVEKYLSQVAYPNTANTVEAKIEELAHRTGLKQYINQINAELDNAKTAEDKNNDGQQDSLIDIAEVKEAIDEAINMKHYNSTIDLLKRLEQEIKFNNTIPDYLKNVFSDKRLKEYVDSHLVPEKSDKKINLLLKDTNTEQKEQEPYFNFNQNETQK